MNQFAVFRYIKKYQGVIAAVSLLVGAAFYIIAGQFLQTYTAATVIQYTNAEAESGYAPDGTRIDTTEIYASNVVSLALEELGLDSANMDTVRNGISVEPLFTEEQQMTFEAQLNAGEEAELISSQYLVTFTSGVANGREFPRQVLNQVLEEYSQYYGQNHVNSPGVTNGINDIYSKGYDYIEMMEVIDADLESTLSSLNDKIQANDSFRSYKTGYAFSDLYREFDLIREVEVPQLASNIISRQITKDRDVLLAKYHNRNNDLSIDNTAANTEIEKIIGIIDSYVDMMSESDNTNITYEYILDSVYDNFSYDENGNAQQGGDKTTEYDTLLGVYVNNRSVYENNLIDTAYNQYIQDVFSTAPEQSSEEVLNETQSRIESMVSRINNLYSILADTNDEYNEYLGAANITMLSSVGVTEAIPVARFTVLVICVFGLVGCLGAVVIGRIEDIIHYYALTNKVTGLPNRAGCDNYIALKARKMLSGQSVCTVFKLTNLQEENVRLGRTTGDEMMKAFADILTGVFVPSEDVFVGYNGSGQYLVFADQYNEEKLQSALSQILVVTEQRCENEPYQIQYLVGTACAEKEKCYSIRKLLSIAMTRMDEPQKNAEVQRKQRQAEEESTITFDEVAASSTLDEPSMEETETKPDTESKMFDINEDYYQKFLSTKNKFKGN